MSELPDASMLREALRDVVEAVVDTQVYGDIEGGCEGNGPLIRAIKMLGQPMPDSLVEWLGHDGSDEEYAC